MRVRYVIYDGVRVRHIHTHKHTHMHDHVRHANTAHLHAEVTTHTDAHTYTDTQYPLQFSPFSEHPPFGTHRSKHILHTYC